MLQSPNVQNQYAHAPLDIVQRRNPWENEGLARVPWAGLGAMSGAVVGIAASVAILASSDGVEITQWSFQPTVYLSITSTLTNIMIFFALSKGVTITWWARALKQNTHVSDLHHCWAAGNSLFAAVTSGRNFNLIALASIFVALAPINGSLLQRASHVASRTVSTNVTLTIQLAPVIPDGFTGYIEGREHQASLLKSKFAPVVSAFYDRASINITETGCKGTCSTVVTGVGFNVSCSGYHSHYDLTPVMFPNGTGNLSAPSWQGIDIFRTSVKWDNNSPGILSISVQYKPDGSCNGSLVGMNCTLAAATVRYPATVDGDQNSITLTTNSTIYDDEVLSINQIQFASGPGDSSTLGGLYLALANKLSSSANMRFAGAIGYDISTSGVIAHQFMVVESIGYVQDCGIVFGDPTNYMLANVRELMFRTAAAAADRSNIQQVQALQVAKVTVYESNHLYLGLASLFTLLALLFVFPTFSGYWYLGRQVSMSPIEIAKAFNAPFLRNEDSNAEVDQLIKDVGSKNVRYGAVLTGFGNVNSIAEAAKMDQKPLLHQYDSPSMRLQMASSNEVIEPRRGWEFGG